MWDEDLWGVPPAQGPEKGPEPEPVGEWSPDLRRPGPQTTRAKVTVLVVALALLVGTVILCCTAANRLAELYFLDLNPVYLL